MECPGASGLSDACAQRVRHRARDLEYTLRKRPAQRRIHAAALRLFAERGTPQISISELAHEADLARGTIYNNISEPNELFENIAAELVEEMYNRITDALKSVEDPAERVSIAVRTLHPSGARRARLGPVPAALCILEQLLARLADRTTAGRPEKGAGQWSLRFPGGSACLRGDVPVRQHYVRHASDPRGHADLAGGRGRRCRIPSERLWPSNRRGAAHRLDRGAGNSAPVKRSRMMPARSAAGSGLGPANGIGHEPIELRRSAGHRHPAGCVTPAGPWRAFPQALQRRSTPDFSHRRARGPP